MRYRICNCLSRNEQATIKPSHPRNLPIDVAKDLLEHGRLVQHHNLIIIIPMRAGMDDAVHVEVEVVYLAIDVQAVVDALVDVGILVGQPPEHLGDAVKGRCGRRSSSRRFGGRRIGIGCIGIWRTPKR